LWTWWWTFRFHKKAGYFLTSWVTMSFSNNILHHGVSEWASKQASLMLSIWKLVEKQWCTDYTNISPGITYYWTHKPAFFRPTFEIKGKILMPAFITNMWPYVWPQTWQKPLTECGTMACNTH
jgi:hypothetical protein